MLQKMLILNQVGEELLDGEVADCLREIELFNSGSANVFQLWQYEQQLAEAARIRHRHVLGEHHLRLVLETLDQARLLQSSGFFNLN